MSFKTAPWLEYWGGGRGRESFLLLNVFSACNFSKSSCVALLSRVLGPSVARQTEWLTSQYGKCVSRDLSNDAQSNLWFSKSDTRLQFLSVSVCPPPGWVYSMEAIISDSGKRRKNWSHFILETTATSLTSHINFLISLVCVSHADHTGPQGCRQFSITLGWQSPLRNSLAATQSGSSVWGRHSSKDRLRVNGYGNGLHGSWVKVSLVPRSSIGMTQWKDFSVKLWQVKSHCPFSHCAFTSRVH